MNKVCVLGSLNMDLVIGVKSIPKVGETVLANEFSKNPGGKGANQAVAAARLGSEVHMIGKVGKDDLGTVLVDHLKKDKINTDFIFQDPINSTGTAVINVDGQGNNSIIVIPGSNMNIKKEEVHKAYTRIEDADVLVSQFEIPIEIIIEAFKFAKEKGVITLLNPAPAKDIPSKLLELTDIIVPNETEIFSLVKIKVDNIDDANKAGKKLIEKGVKYVIITLGEKGAALVSKDHYSLIPGYKVKAVDTTAAGDAFIGALASRLCKEVNVEYELLKESVPFSNFVSSKAVIIQGAQPSLPYLKDLKK